MPVHCAYCVPAGHLVTLPGPDDVPATADVHTGWTVVEPDSGGLRAIAELVAAGKLRPEIDTVFSLADAAKAHAYGETGRTRGKIVLQVV
ncbi:zinc-binding dehydrogenase [Nocardia sp. NPDC052112]|uniref:zinc-binding dehydrogenase n=1 Tax=Nocardia sp. NPDC052112 TaxID=3155646 RepID=UPI00341293C9